MADVLSEALLDASPDLMRSLLQTMINALLSADADAVVGAEWGKPSPDRLAQRNGYRHRDLDTRVGTIDVAIPKLRAGTCFPEWLLERRKRAETEVRDGGHVRNKAAHIAVGIDMDGIEHVLGIWVQATEGAKFWAAVCAELANRGVKEVLIVCCDGLTGLPEAVEATWPEATIQTCVVHLEVHIASRRQREKLGARFSDSVAVTFAGDESHAVPLFDEMARDAEQRNDVAGGGG